MLPLRYRCCISLFLSIRIHNLKMTAAPKSGVVSFPRIKEIKTFLIQGVGSGGDYHNVKGGHWLIDSKISTPMSGYDTYTRSRTSWGINVLGSFCVELEATDGTKGFATGFGGPPACWLCAEHFRRFLIGAGRSHSRLLFQILTDHRRPTRHQPSVRADVPCFDVLWAKRLADSRYICHRSRNMGPSWQDPK